MAKPKQKKDDSATIGRNKKAFHDYFITDRVEAGIVLEGWEVKSLREKKLQLVDSHVFMKNGEAWLVGAVITPLLTASTHIKPEQRRARKLLMHSEEISKLVGSVERKGFTIIPLAMYWKRGKAKVELGLAKGKQQHDKRATEKDMDWKRQKQRILRAK